MPYHVIFEGAELSGKSWIMSQIYERLEPSAATSQRALNGCHWFNCDLGFFGSLPTKRIIKSYLDIFKELKERNVLVEKFHLSDAVYGSLYGSRPADFRRSEKKLKKLGFKIILLTFPEDENLIGQRLADRLRLYPAYRRIAKNPDFYFQQQARYLEKIKVSALDYLIVEAAFFPNEMVLAKIIDWLGIK